MVINSNLICTEVECSEWEYSVAHYVFLNIFLLPLTANKVVCVIKSVRVQTL